VVAERFAAIAGRAKALRKHQSPDEAAR